MAKKKRLSILSWILLLLLVIVVVSVILNSGFDYYAIDDYLSESILFYLLIIVFIIWLDYPIVKNFIESIKQGKVKISRKDSPRLTYSLLFIELIILLIFLYVLVISSMIIYLAKVEGAAVSQGIENPLILLVLVILVCGYFLIRNFIKLVRGGVNISRKDSLQFYSFLFLELIIVLIGVLLILVSAFIIFGMFVFTGI